MWANVSHWSLHADRIEDEQFIHDAVGDASELVARQAGFVQFQAIRTAPDKLVVVTLWENAAAAKKAAELTPLVRDFYRNYVASAELSSGDVLITRNATETPDSD